MKKLKYIQPLARQVILDVEQMVSNTPATNGLENPGGGNGNITDVIDDDGSGDEEEWGNVKGDQGIWNDMW